MAIKHPTPLLDQLETGPWPSFVSDIKQEAEYRAANPDNVEFQVPADAPDDLLGVLELSYKEGETHWKHGGIVGVFGYGGGVIGRYCDQPEMFPGVAHFHTVRVAQPSGKYYSTEFLRGLCDIWELRGSGLTNMHGSTGDIVLIGTQTPQLEEIFYDLTRYKLCEIKIKISLSQILLKIKRIKDHWNIYQCCLKNRRAIVCHQQIGDK